MNTWTTILPVPSDGPFFWMLVGVQCLVAAVVVVVFGPRRLSRLPETAMPFATGTGLGDSGRGTSLADAVEEKAA